MRFFRHVPVAVLLASGCTREPMPEVPISASEMPASFAYGELGPDQAHYRRGIEPRSGADIRQMLMSSQQEFAAFAVVTLNGGMAFTPAAFRRRLEPILPPDQEIVWGDISQSSGMHPTKYVTFAMPGKELHCVGMERSIKDHPEAQASAFSQGLAIGYYCREGEPFSAEEAANVVAALHTS